ncbi:MAG TPA: FkbM family methyltransferase, partial [Verrucomicrobiae bacterium]|nr:FkbM family methyltransferase [Verrucomicrobiae bacterium]
MASLKRLVRNFRRRLVGAARQGVTPLPRHALRQADAIVTTNEVTDRHGTGVILSRIFDDSANILSIRSSNLYHEHRLGAEAHCLAHEGLSRSQSFERVLYALNGNQVRRVLCIPFLPDELVTAIVLKELFNAPLCVYLMDDNNVYARGIPDELMREALGKAALRLAISPEMRDAYEKKYSLKFWVVPPIVTRGVPPVVESKPGEHLLEYRTGILVGNLWSRRWLTELRRTVKEAGLQLHWYGNTRASWLKVTSKELEADGIIDCGFLAEPELSERVRQYPYAVIPSGRLDAQDDRPEIGRLSLPTRMPYLLATANTPMIVLGSEQTGAARFVDRFDVGRTVPYEGSRLRDAVLDICRPQKQLALRRSAARHARIFSGNGMAQWIWQSLEKGEPVDERFETPFLRAANEIVTYLDPPAPRDLWGDFILVYQALRRLKAKGFRPDFIVDVGASSGVWSDVARRVFTDSRFVLVEPLCEQYRQLSDWYFKQHPDFEWVGAALSDRPGEAELRVSEDLYGSSLLCPEDSRAYRAVKVPVRTLDEVAREKHLSGRGLLKVDVQFTEHLVLDGGKELLPQVDALLVELSLFRYSPQALIFPEMYELIRDLGFQYYEDVGGWRSPVDGTTLHKDVLFVRNGLLR